MPQAAPPAVAPAPAAGSGALELPFVQAVLAGAPAGYAFAKGMQTPSIEVLKAGVQEVVEAGLDFYKPDDKSLDAVMFNPAIFSEEAIVKADKAGILKDLFPPFLPENDSILAQSLAEPGALPAPTEGDVMPAAPSAPMPSGGPSAAAQGATAGIRADAMKQKTPSQRQKPGAGTVLNSLIQRTV
jgi:hypothetical protein